jgi:hypothetical protein
MRTRALLCAAALAAGAVSSMAQNVYSLNVVGYVNYAFPTAGSYYLISNPLDNTNSDLNTIIPTAPAGTQIQLWNVGLQDFDPTIPTYNGVSHVWVPDSTIKPGQGFFVVPNGPFTNTFVGNVRQGPVTNAIAGSGAYVAIGSTVPLSGNITNVLDQYPALGGDQIQLWSVALQDFSPTIPTYNAVSGKWAPDYNGFNVGDGFFIVRNGASVSYVRSFTVQ